MKDRFLAQAGISQRHLEKLLRKDRNATEKTARRLERATRGKIPKEAWVFWTEKQRRAAWKKFIHEEGWYDKSDRRRS